MTAGEAQVEASARSEIGSGKRFAFGRNWARFLAVLDEDRIREAERSLKTMLEVEDLRGLAFLDIGSGSGLFSLAARRLGARVRSFDYDADSVACTRELRRRYRGDDPEWVVEPGSVLDDAYMDALGLFDVVYSWGVLHHTGDLWKALESAGRRVAAGGRLFIAVYNDQGMRSVCWRRIKQVYCSGLPGKVLVCATLIPALAGAGFLNDILRRRSPFRRYTGAQFRGMSTFYDCFDWLGGLPFEVARPEAIFRFYHERGFVLANLTTVGGRLGNNQYVFVKP